MAQVAQVARLFDILVVGGNIYRGNNKKKRCATRSTCAKILLKSAHFEPFSNNSTIRGKLNGGENKI